MRLKAYICLFVIGVCAQDPGQQRLLPPFAPPASECKTFTCVQSSYIEAALRGPFNLTAMANKQFGPDARIRMQRAFKKIQVDRPVIERAVVQTHETGLKISANIQLYSGRYDAHYEGIYVVEHGGFVTMHTGITFNHSTTAEEIAAGVDNVRFGEEQLGFPGTTNLTESMGFVMPVNRTTERKLFAPLAAVAPMAIQWTGAALGKGAAGVAAGTSVSAIARGAVAGASTKAVVGGVVGMTFARALVLMGGLKDIPQLGFLQDSGDVAILVTVRARLTEDVYQSVSPVIQRMPVNPFKMSGVLEDFVLTTNKVILVGAFTLERDCTDLMCKLVKRFVPEGTRLQFTYNAGFVYIEAFNVFTRKRISAGLGNIKLRDKFVIHDAAFFVDLGMGGFYPGITGTMLMTPFNTDRPIRLKTEIAIGLPWFDYQILFAFEGIYERAFNIPFLHIGNIHGEAFFIAGAWPTAFRFGTEYWIGKAPVDTTEKDTRIRRSAFMGFDLFNPINWYFYGFLSDLTFQSILDMIYDYNDNVSPQLPPFLGDTGLSGLPGNDGVLISFTPVIDYTVEFVDPPRTIRAGLTVAGQASLFGLNLIVDMNFDLITVGCDITLAFEPIKIGNGLMTLSKSINNTQEGPYGRMQMVLMHGIMPNITFDGYAEFLGMGMGISGHISRNGVRAAGDLRLFNVLDSHAEIVWNTTTDTTQIHGNITQRVGFLDMLEDTARKWWKKIRHRRLLQAQPFVMAENHTHLTNLLLEDEREISVEELADMEDLEDESLKDAIAVKFTDGRVLTQEKFFDFIPFRIHIDEMSFVLHCQKGEDKHLAVQLRIRKTLFGKTTIVHKSAKLDVKRPKVLVKEILNSMSV